MNRVKLVIVVFLILSLVFITGCGRKTAPVYTEKDEVSTPEKDKMKE